MARYDDVDSYYDHGYDYDNLARNCDDLYTCDEESFDDDAGNDETKWENYYHNIADELIEE
jgi:hypothetical protein